MSINSMISIIHVINSMKMGQNPQDMLMKLDSLPFFMFHALVLDASNFVAIVAVFSSVPYRQLSVRG